MDKEEKKDKKEVKQVYFKTIILSDFTFTHFSFALFLL